MATLKFKSVKEFENADKNVAAAKAFRSSQCGQEEMRKRDLVYWPSRTAFDRQVVEVGVPFYRKGEWIVLVRRESGALKSIPLPLGPGSFRQKEKE